MGSGNANGRSLTPLALKALPFFTMITIFFPGIVGGRERGTGGDAPYVKGDVSRRNTPNDCWHFMSQLKYYFETT